MNVTEYIAAQNAKTLVDMWNLVHPSTPIKKFTDRKTANARMLKLMGGSPDYLTFFSRHAETFRQAKIELPSPVRPILPKKVVAASGAPVAAAPARPPKSSGKKPKPSPHLNLRCPTCNYYAKTNLEWLGRGRLVCPVDPKHGILKTAEERGENRGREVK